MKVLIGNTGTIGTTLKDSIQFDYEFNSKNLSTFDELVPDNVPLDLYLCCLPATKWLINKEPLNDFRNIIDILKVLEVRRYSRIILYSTIDVYQDAPLGVDETYVPSASRIGQLFDYGNNRYLFELFIKHCLSYNNLVIFRLPALYGKHIKKNVLYDILNKNRIESINYNSTYQWFNLDRLAQYSQDHLNHVASINKSYHLVNMFPEPLPTSDLLAIAGIAAGEVDTNSKPVVYDYKTNTVVGGYIAAKESVLQELKSIIELHQCSSLKIAVCLFGEERDLLSRLPHWKYLSSKLNVEYYIASYTNSSIQATIATYSKEVTLKNYHLEDNNLDEFDKLKLNATHPIYLYGYDKTATFCRISSQLNIRQKAISLLEEDYDVVILCRTDRSDIDLTYQDVLRVAATKDLLIVNSHTHIHPGGGRGCQQCTANARCEHEFHANDICDLWCMGSGDLMKEWSRVFTDQLTLYRDIQKTAEIPSTVQTTVLSESNEVIINVTHQQIPLIENQVHCWYPEKIMRSLFKHAKIVGASDGLNIWGL